MIHEEYEILCHKADKDMKDICTDNKILWWKFKIETMLMSQKIQRYQHQLFPNWFNDISVNQNLSRFLINIEHLIIKFIQKYKVSEKKKKKHRGIAKPLLEMKNKARKRILPDFNYYKVTIIKMTRYWHKDKQRGTEWNWGLKNKPIHIQTTNFHKGKKTTHWRINNLF